jgi:uncharacterized protein with GYD domain
MATYISLVQFTDKGIQAAKETTQRVAEWASKVQSRWGKHQADVLDAWSI